MSLFSGKRRRMVSGRPDIPSAPERPVPVWSAPCCPGRDWRHRRGYGNLSGACHSQGKSGPFSPEFAAEALFPAPPGKPALPFLNHRQKGALSQPVQKADLFFRKLQLQTAPGTAAAASAAGFTFAHIRCPPFFQGIIADGRQNVKLSREPLNKSPSAVSGSFPSTLRHRKREIHTVFLRFRYLDWTKNLSLTALVDLIRGSSARRAPCTFFKIRVYYRHRKIPRRNCYVRYAHYEGQLRRAGEKQR